ncbi:hypothetical protein CPT_Milagro_044 [Burkholderia phage Milagro]|uniref:Uncharacterized protein n=1 Tax=Burkholderia phage Milagro TaxID=2924901 RepID=A0AAE9K4U0_9CAUD|nr:hypothetical protein CPT_Milagro_044 [Burkholderia phage Milagro]
MACMFERFFFTGGQSAGSSGHTSEDRPVAMSMCRYAGEAEEGNCLTELSASYSEITVWMSLGSPDWP